MSVHGRIDDVDLVVGDLADLARGRAGEFASTSRDPDCNLEAELDRFADLPPRDKARFHAAALINYLVAVKR